MNFDCCSQGFLVSFLGILDVAKVFFCLFSRFPVDHLAHQQALAFLFERGQLVLIQDLGGEDLLALPADLLVRDVVQVWQEIVVLEQLIICIFEVGDVLVLRVR